MLILSSTFRMTHIDRASNFLEDDPDMKISHLTSNCSNQQKLTRVKEILMCFCFLCMVDNIIYSLLCLLLGRKPHLMILQCSILLNISLKMQIQTMFLKFQIESFMVDLSQNFTQLYFQSYKNASKGPFLCLLKSFNRVVGKSRKDFCLPDYPKQKKCLTNGRLVPYSSAVQLNPSKAQKNEQLFHTCTSALLDEMFRQGKKQFNQIVTTFYYGDKFGVFRQYPPKNKSIHQQRVKINNQQRHWYQHATSYPRNLFILIDMNLLTENNKSYFTRIKEELQKLLLSLNHHDFFSVGFLPSSEQAQIPIINEGSLRATSSNIQNFIDIIKNLDGSDKTLPLNYEKALEIMKTLFNRELSDKFGLSCNKKINIAIILAVERPTLGLTSHTDLINKFNEIQSQNEINLLLFGFGQKNDRILLKSLACASNGIFYNYPGVKDLQHFPQNFKQFHKMIASRLNNDQPMWTTPYQDQITNEQQISIVIPVYRYQKEERQIFAVLGADLPIQVFQDQNKQLIIKNFVTCPYKKLKIQTCGVQYSRPSQFKCFPQNCQKLINGFDQPIGNISQTEVFENKQQYTAVDDFVLGCCSSYSGNFELFTWIIFVFVLIISLVTILMFWKKFIKARSHYYHKDQENQLEENNSFN